MRKDKLVEKSNELFVKLTDTFQLKEQYELLREYVDVKIELDRKRR